MSISSERALLANQVSDVDYPDNFEEFIDVFNIEIKKIIDAINSKEGGLYTLQELSTFNRYYDTVNLSNLRNVYRRTINFGRLPNATTKHVSHGNTLNSEAKVTKLYGGATNLITGSFIPLPFSSTTLADNIILQATLDEVIVTTGANYSDYTDCTIVFEYVRN